MRRHSWRLEAKILEGIAKVFQGDGSWEQRTKLLFDLRSEIVHGVVSDLGDWNEDPIPRPSGRGARLGWDAQTEFESLDSLQHVREILGKASPLWMIEISVPELFPTNLRELGEIVLNAGLEVKPDDRLFLLARLPVCYLSHVTRVEKLAAKFRRRPSNIFSHSALWRCDDTTLSSPSH